MPSNKCISPEAVPNVQAFLKLIRHAEHGREIGDVYGKLYGGHQFVTDLTRHPNQSVTAWGRTSTAAGAYQINNPTYNEAAKRGINTDFTPYSQDKIAIWLIQTKGALPAVMEGSLDKAVPLLRGTWPSLPGRHPVKNDNGGSQAAI